MATSEIKVGPPGGALGDSAQVVARGDKTGALVVTEAHGDYNEASIRGNVYSMQLGATTGAAAAGNLVGAAAAAVTQFAVFNPVSSGYNLSILRFGFVSLSGTTAAGPIMHGIFLGGVPTLAANGTIRNNLINGRASVAIGYASAGGAALTGGTLGPQILMMTAFGSTAVIVGSQQTDAGGDIQGLIVLPPGTGWAPLLQGVGTTHLVAYSVSWEEVPV